MNSLADAGAAQEGIVSVTTGMLGGLGGPRTQDESCDWHWGFFWAIYYKDNKLLACNLAWLTPHRYFKAGRSEFQLIFLLSTDRPSR